MLTRICAWIVRQARLDLRTVRSDDGAVTVDVYANGCLIARSKDGADDVFGCY